MTPLLVAVIPAGFSLVYGHRPSLEVQAESRTAARLGPEYAGYRYLVRRLDQVFRKESVTIEASVIAYDVDLHDVRDLTVTWTER